jgi:hypothetical protein
MANPQAAGRGLTTRRAYCYDPDYYQFSVCLIMASSSTDSKNLFAALYGAHITETCTPSTDYIHTFQFFNLKFKAKTVVANLRKGSKPVVR